MPRHNKKVTHVPCTILSFARSWYLTNQAAFVMTYPVPSITNHDWSCLCPIGLWCLHVWTNVRPTIWWNESDHNDWLSALTQLWPCSDDQTWGGTVWSIAQLRCYWWHSCWNMYGLLGINLHPIICLMTLLSSGEELHVWLSGYAWYLLFGESNIIVVEWAWQIFMIF